jgi:hypothetical protein
MLARLLRQEGIKVERLHVGHVDGVHGRQVAVLRADNRANQGWALDTGVIPLKNLALLSE